MTNKLTPMQAIVAMCKSCIYDAYAQGAGTWRQQVEDCTAPDCPLFHLRPVTKGTMEKRKAEKIANMTPAQLEAYQRKADAARERFSS